MSETRVVRIGGAGGFLGDSATAAPQLLRGGRLDYMILDYLAEATMSALGQLKAARPDILPRAMQALLPDFVVALDPLYQDYLAASDRPADFASFLQDRSDAAVDALLGVTDARAARVHNPAIKSVYARLRGGAESEVGAALPDFASLLSNYLARATT